MEKNPGTNLARAKSRRVKRVGWVVGLLLWGVWMPNLASAAPFVGPNLEEVIRILSARDAHRQMPLTLGRNEPQAVIDFKDGMWRFSRLERKPTTPKATPNAQGTYVPEMTWSELSPAAPLIQEADKKQFIKRLRSIDWTFSR